MGIGLRTLDILGAPVEPGQSEGPSTTLTVLGIEVDTHLMQLRLPDDKLARLAISQMLHKTGPLPHRNPPTHYKSRKARTGLYIMAND